MQGNTHMLKPSGSSSASVQHLQKYSEAEQQGPGSDVNHFCF